MEVQYKNDLVKTGEYAEAVTALTEYCDKKLNNVLSMMIGDVLSVRPENPALVSSSSAGLSCASSCIIVFSCLSPSSSTANDRFLGGVCEEQSGLFLKRG